MTAADPGCGQTAGVDGWNRLDPRMIIVRPLNELLGLLPLLFALLFLGNVSFWRTMAGVGTVVLIILYGLLSWLTTKYRITDTQVELHKGVVLRKRLSIPRDRIRTVDLTARLGHRLFGLSAVRVGTGKQEKTPGEGVVLDAVTAAEADRLRQVLLLRGPAPIDAAHTAENPEGTPISALSNRWYRYAPLTLSGVISIGVAVGFLMNLANELELSEIGAIRAVFGWFSRADVTIAVAVVAGVILVLSVLFSLLTYLLQNHNYRLTRQDDGTLRVRRGLLTTRSVSVEEERLRGVALHEPLLLRAGRGARLNAVTTGLGPQGSSSLLLPPAPRTEADRVTADVLRVDVPPAMVHLPRHPVQARTRRLTRAVVPTLTLAAAFSALSSWAGWPNWPWITALALVPIFVLIGLDRYRNLGTALTDRYLVTRAGSLNRRTVALQRTGIIGWHITSSPFQRRSGLVSITAVTAAGSSAYPIVDIGESDGLAIADTAVPHVLRPFLEH